MPQLMPFLWVSSVFMNFLLLLMLLFMYSVLEKLNFIKLGKMKCNGYMIKW